MSDNFHHIFETTFCSVHHIFGTTFLDVHHIFGTTFLGVHHIFGTTLQKCMPILEYSPLLLFYSFTFLPFYYS